MRERKKGRGGDRLRKRGREKGRGGGFEGGL